MGGRIRQFVDTSTGTGAIAVAGSGVEFDAIIGSDARAAASAPRSERPPVARPTRRRGGRGPALVAISALAISGIAIGGGLVVAAHLVGRDAVAAADAVLASDKAAPARVETSPTAVFGSAAGIGGLAVTISDPIAFSPSATATGADAGVDVVSTVTVTNLGAGPIDPTLSLHPLGTTATRVFDRAQGIRTNTTPSLAAGESITYRVAYAVGDVAEFSLEVTGSDGDTLVYGS